MRSPSPTVPLICAIMLVLAASLHPDLDVFERVLAIVLAVLALGVYFLARWQRRQGW